MNINAIRQELAGKFTGFHQYYTEPTTMEYPAVVVPFPAIEYNETLGGRNKLSFGLRLVVSTSDEATADRALGDALDALTATVYTAATNWRGIVVESSETPTNPKDGSATVRQVVVNLVVHA